MPSLVDRAIGFAARAHDGQQRKTGSKVPYIAHPVAVAMILQEMGCEDSIVAAGLLHDTVEDTRVTLDDIRGQFGDEVAIIVAGCTEPPKKKVKWERRKRDTIQKLREAPLSVKLVSAADKYHNLSHTLYTKQQIGDKVWKRFGRGEGQQAWYYRSVLESLKSNITDLEDYPIFDKLEAIIEELFEGVPSQPPV